MTARFGTTLALSALLALGITPSARAVPVATGTIEVQGCFGGGLGGQIVLDDATFDVFGAPVNLGAPEPLYDRLRINGGTYVFGNPNTFSLPLYNGTNTSIDVPPSVLGMTVTGVFVPALEPGFSYTFVGDATDVVGTRAALLPNGVKLTLDGSVASGTASGTCIPFSGPVALNGFLPVPTPAGTDVALTVPITFTNSATGEETGLEVGIVFDTINGEGETTVTALSNVAGSIPANLSLTAGGYEGFFFDVSTDAGYSPPIQICSSYPDADDDGIVDGSTIAAPALRLLHREDGAFVDRTDLPVDTVNHRVCGTVMSLSPFALAVNTVADQDGDGVADAADNCPLTANADQADADADGRGDLCDNCPTTANVDQTDFDGDALGDACDPDIDDDGVANESDACPGTTDDAAVDASGCACADAGHVSCDDGNQCTDDGCDVQTGFCASSARTGSCDDGNPVTNGDQCVDGICLGTSVVCGNGVLEDGEQCDDGTTNGTAGSCCDVGCDARSLGSSCADDGDLCTSDVCEAGVCTHPSTPAATCATPTVAGGALLKIKAATSDQVKLKWGKGPIVPASDFGDPATATAYRLCVYEGDGTLAYHGSPTCRTSSCWKALPTGWKFKSTAGDGITGVLLKAGTAPSKAKLLVTAKGALPMVEPPLAGPVVAQVRTSDGKCWGATFAAPKKNADGSFVAKSN